MLIIFDNMNSNMFVIFLVYLIHLLISTHLTVELYW